MKKLLSKTFAVLLASTILFTGTGFSSLAANFDTKTANVYSFNATANTEQDTSDTTTINEPDSSKDNAENTTASTLPTNTDTIEDSTKSEDLTTKETETDTTNNPLDNQASNETQSEVTNPLDVTTGEEESMTNETKILSEMDANKASNEASNYTWQGVAFGQSTDLNFMSTILPEKIGTQYARETQISVLDAASSLPTTKDAVVIESRGGKIANAHDGLTFYYTTLPTSKNFVLEAKVFINQFGPENGSTPSKQEAVGVMARDVIAAARQEPMLDGYEELPAASNIASTMVIANAKSHTTPLNISSYQRNGVFYPYGNAHVSYGATKFAQINGNQAKTVTADVTPAEGENYKSEDFFTLRLERTDSGFITTYIGSDGTEKSGSIDDADRVAVIDEENMYVGFFASRNAKVTYTDIYLTTSDANTAPCSFTPESYALSFSNLSNTTTSTSDYTVAFRSNFDGTVEIIQDGSVIEAAGNVTAGEIYELSTTLTKDSTDFTINYASNNGAKSETFTVTKNESLKKDLYAAVDGTSSGNGSIDSPLDLSTAINYLAEGYTLYVRGGTYGALDLSSTVSGSSKGMKTLSAYNGEMVVFNGNSYVKASYWNILGIDITGSNSAGLRASGNNNTFESCSFYGNEDTGFQLGMGSDTDPLTWPENNTIRYCTSYNNVDASGINADGFAAKLGVGKGNLFDSCLSYDNADDGWDLFNKLGDAKNEPVTIQNCVAYGNGNNGFKLGGEGYAVNHVIANCLAYKNNLDGFTDNFNTGVLTVSNCTSVDNVRYNYIFRFNPYANGGEVSTFTNNLSFRSSYDDNSYTDYIAGNVVNSYFFADGNGAISANDFISVTPPSSYERNADGTINYGDYMRPSKASILANSGSGSTSYIGAISPDTLPVVTPDVLVRSITLNQTDATLKVMENLALSASVAPEDATNKAITWTSSNPSVASVDANGTVQAIAEGSAVISATSSDGSNVSATCNITVQPNIVSVSSVTLNQSTLVLAKGKSETLTASIAPENATNKAITWTSSNPSVASVDANGTVSTTSYGTAVITATSAENAAITATCNVTVGYKITYKLNKGINNEKNPSAYYKQKITLASPNRKGYVFKGWYTDKKLTKKITTIKKNSAKNITVYAKWEKVSKPDAPSLKNVTNKKGSKMKVTLDLAVSGAKGYEITYATNKKFTKNKSNVTITKASTLSKTISKLTKGSKYYVKVRAYKVDSQGNKIYGKYSNTLNIKIKK